MTAAARGTDSWQESLNSTCMQVVQFPEVLPATSQLPPNYVFRAFSPAVGEGWLRGVHAAAIHAAQM